jgi:hypothetical protein
MSIRLQRHSEHLLDSRAQNSPLAPAGRVPLRTRSARLSGARELSGGHRGPDGRACPARQSPRLQSRDASHRGASARTPLASAGSARPGGELGPPLGAKPESVRSGGRELLRRSAGRHWHCLCINVMAGIDWTAASAFFDSPTKESCRRGDSARHGASEALDLRTTPSDRDNQSSENHHTVGQHERQDDEFVWSVAVEPAASVGVVIQ